MKRVSARVGIVAGIALLLTLGAGPFKTDDKVEVDKDATWTTATVLAQEGRRVHVHYPDGKPDEWVPADQVRPADQVKPTGTGPATPAVKFQPAQSVTVTVDGKPKSATVIAQEGRRVHVRYKIGKTDEWVPTEQVTAVAAAKSDDSTPATAGENAAAYATLDVKWQGVRSLNLSFRQKTWAYKPPAATADKAVSPKSMRVSLAHEMFEEFRGLLTSSPAAGVLAVVNAARAHGGEGTVFRVERFDLVAGQSMGVVTLPADEVPLALSPDGKSLLCKFGDKFGGADGKRLDWFDLAGGSPRHVVSWPSDDPKQGVWAGVAASAVFLDAGHFWVTTGHETGTVWEWKDGKPKPLFKIAGGMGSTGMVADHRVYWASEAKAVTLFETATCRPLGRIESEGSYPRLFSDPTGANFCLVGNTGKMELVDGATGKKVRTFDRPANFGMKKVEVIAPDWLLGDDSELVDAIKGRKVWEYTGNQAAGDNTAWFMGRLYYYRGRQFGKPEDGTLASAVIPHKAAVDAAKDDATTGKTALGAGGLTVDGTEADPR